MPIKSGKKQAAMQAKIFVDYYRGKIQNEVKAAKKDFYASIFALCIGNCRKIQTHKRSVREKHVK